MKLEKKYIIDYYNGFYEKDDFRYYPKNISLKLLKTLSSTCETKKGGKILDLGCGTGFYTELFRNMGFDSLGIDISQTAINKAKEKYPDSKFEVADALNLSYEKKSFNMIFLFGCSIVNTDDLEEIDRVFKYLLEYLTDDGKIVFIGGSDLSGKQSVVSEWYNHTWKQLISLSKNKTYIIKGPFMSHLRIIYLFGSFGYSRIVTLLLKLKFFKFQRKIIYFINK
jgi:ubiquinone/menaquinone biosynthesis C-methylase UbiE